MVSKQELVKKIVDKEWAMFQKVSSVDGRASCQDDPATFRIMRSSQFLTWTEAMLLSYLKDLEEAETAGRNLLSDKYALMMKSTSPLEYEQIRDLLPRMEAGVAPLIDRIAEIVLGWAEELSRKYPYVLQRGRPLRKSEDSIFRPSLETYLRGELATYSRRTLKLYYENVLKQEAENLNGSEMVLENQVRQYGYASLEAANNGIRERQ